MQLFKRAASVAEPSLAEGFFFGPVQSIFSTNCRFAEKARPFRSLLAGHAARLPFTVAKDKTLYIKSDSCKKS